MPDTATSQTAPRAREEIHVKVMELIHSMGPANGRRVLDAPLGPGALAHALVDLGWNVSGADIDLEQSAHLDGKVDRKLANLNEPFPFDDESFDLVTSLEGIEHVENHFHVLREMGRVTKPGAHLIITTPNICNLEERLNFLLRGAFFEYIPRKDMEKYGSGFNHQNLITSLELHQVIDWGGFDIIGVEKDRPKWKQNIFLFPFWCMIKLMQLVQSSKRIAKYKMDENNCSNVLLGGPTVIFLGRKRG